MTDVATGRSFDFTTQIGVGGGFGAGRFDINGTIPGFESLDQGFGIAFVAAGYKGLGVSTGQLHSIGGSREVIGQVTINPGTVLGFIPASTPGGADIGFKNGVTRTPRNAGSCRRSQ